MAPPLSLPVSHVVSTELTTFLTSFDAALATQETPRWAQAIGQYESTDALTTVYPLDIGVVGYREFEGDMKFRKMYGRSLQMRQKRWQDGVMVSSDMIESKDWVGWGKRPADMARAARQLVNDMTASMLNDNPLLDFYTDRYEGGIVASTIRLFAGNHPVNIYDSSKGTFDNDHTWTGTLTDSLVDTIKERFYLIKGVDGRGMGLSLKSLIVPAALAHTFQKFFASDILVETILNSSTPVGGVTVPNTHKGTVQIVVAPELDQYSTTTFYAVDDAASASPWILQEGTSPLTIIHDESSEMFKTSLQVAISSVLRAGVGAAFPHAIQRYSV